MKFIVLLKGTITFEREITAATIEDAIAQGKALTVPNVVALRPGTSWQEGDLSVSGAWEN